MNWKPGLFLLRFMKRGFQLTTFFICRFFIFKFLVDNFSVIEGAVKIAGGDG